MGRYRWRRAAVAIACGLIASSIPGSTMAGEAPPVPTFLEPHDAIPSMTTPSGEVRDIARIGDRVYVAGSFVALRRFVGGSLITQSYLAAVDADTGEIDTGFAPVLDGEVRALAASPDGSRLYIGGKFTSVNGQPNTYLAALDPETGARIPWASAGFGSVNDIVVDASGDVYVGGFFGQINGIARPRVAKLDGATGQVSTWYPVPIVSDDTVRALTLSPDETRIYLAGGYTQQVGLPPDQWVFRGFIEAFDTATGARISSFAAAPEYDVLDVDAHGGKVYAALGGPGGRANVYRASSGAELASYFADGDVQAVSVVGNKAYFGGHFFEEFGGLPALYVGLVDVDTLAVDATTFSPDLSATAGIWTVEFDGEHLWLGGDINDAEPTAAAGFVRFSQPPSEGDPPSPVKGLSLDAATPTSVTLSWKPSTDASPFSYIVRRDGVKIAEVWGDTTYTDTGLSPATPYRYKVFAKDMWGNKTAKKTLDVATPDVPTTALVAAGTTWRYLDDGSNQGTGWRAPNFDDAAWASGAAELGYGDGDEATVIASGPAGNHHITSYFRRTFGVDGRSAITALELDLLVDDGAVAYLNGTEIARINMPAGPVTYTTPASSGVAGDGEDRFVTVVVDPGLIVGGDNVLAVEVHQVNPTSSDVSFDAVLRASAVEPDLLIAKGAKWAFDDDGDKDSGWKKRTFDDDAWDVGRAQLGYGDGDEATVTRSGIVTTYFRKGFKLTRLERFQIDTLKLKLLRDDGAVVYINGKEVVRSNMPGGDITESTTALKATKGAGESKWRTFEVPVSFLRDGRNVVAVELHQVKKSSPDASFGLKLIGIP